jgi:hypothetical protein
MTTTIETLDEKLPTLSDKYKLAKTSDIIKNMEGLGFIMDKFVALKVKKKERQGYQKHRAIFTSPALKETSDGIPQLLLTNSHDGSSSVVLQLGFYRFICSNGLIAGKTVIEPIRVRHSGNDFDVRLLEAINTIVAQAHKLTESIDKLKAVKLSNAEVATFQREALQKRLGNEAKIQSWSMPIHRNEDNQFDLFTVMNVVQENLIRGGATVIVEEDGKAKNKTIRRVNSIVSQTEINTMLWELAEQKAAA